jgi:hypothetical protein
MDLGEKNEEEQQKYRNDQILWQFFLLGLHYLTLYGAWGLLSDVSVG